jgi:hypothetical protein
MKQLSITRWGIGGSETETYEYEEECVLELHGEQANVAVMSAPTEIGGVALAFFCGVAEARWLDV